MKIAIITAMQSEYEAVKSLYDFKGDDVTSNVSVYGKDITLIRCGMGKVNSALSAQKACDLGADIVITTGLAGGIDDCLKQGDIVLANKVCYHDVWCGDGNEMGQVQNLPLYYSTPQQIIDTITKNAPDFKIGLTVTGDQFITSAEKLYEIKSIFKEALACDMESSAIAQTCYLNNKPVISLRIISDVVGHPEQEELYKQFWKNVPNKAAKMVDTVLKAL